MGRLKPTRFLIPAFIPGIISIGLLVTAVSFAQTRGGPATIGVDEIQPGMTGYGLTVFRGTTPERFDVEVIDVLHGFMPDQDLILVRTDHPILDHANVVAGMSGSPIYLDNRLAGAYAYGWPFGKDPVAGVTPISNMLAEINRPVRPDSFPGADRIAQPFQRGRARPRMAARASPARLSGLPPHTGQEEATPFGAIRAHAERLGDSNRVGPRGLARAQTPIMLGGMSNSVAAQMEAELAPLGLMTLQAGGTSRATPPPGNASFVNGGAIGVQLARGDVSATGVGTVSYVGNQRVLAFGHPMMNAGEIGLPTATARVLHIMASQARSFKLAEAITPLGTLIHDRQPAIVIDPAQNADMIPVRLRLSGLPSAARAEWNIEVVSHRGLTPMFTFGVIANAIQAAASDQTDVVYRANMRVQLRGHGTVELDDVGYMAAGPNSPRGLGGLRMWELMEIAYGNPFEDSRVESVDLSLDLEFSRDIWEIADASIATPEVDPGSTINVYVVLRRFGQPDQVRAVPIEIPAHAAGERVEIKIQSGADVRLEQVLATSLADMLNQVENRLPATTLAVSLKMPGRGMRFQGHVVQQLPRSVMDALTTSTDTDRGRAFITYNRQTVNLGRVLYGSSTLRVQVRDEPLNR